ncbi:radical SAM/SPASM domain-containing protein [Phycobacter sp. K97]|uniref:radical SAM/SPASM domain-containing protein n=1 Tax=Phycobacter sedimenti TaxID=3133977 RepID=UPI00311DC4DE
MTSSVSAAGTARTIEVTTRIGCRLACSYCPQSTLTAAFRTLPDRGKAVMDPADFQSFLSTVPPSVDVHFSGFGEPWHNRDCTQMVEHAVDKGHHVAVFTTADGMTEDDIDRVAQLPLKRFVLHLPDALEEMRLAVNAAYIAKVAYLQNRLADRLELLTIGAPHRAFATLDRRRHMVTRRIQDRAGNVRIEGRTIGSAYSPEDIAVRTRGQPLRCRKDRMLSNVLLPNGDLVVCAMDYGLENRIGNLARQTYAEIQADVPFAQFLRRTLDGSEGFICSRCEYALAGAYSAVEIERMVSDV